MLTEIKDQTKMGESWQVVWVKLLREPRDREGGTAVRL